MADTRTQIAATLFQAGAGRIRVPRAVSMAFRASPALPRQRHQKAELLAIIVPKRPVLWQVVLWSTLCLIVAITCVGLWLYTGHETPTALDTFAIIVLTVAQVVLALGVLFWWKRHRLRPLLATLTPTDLRITQSEMRAAVTNAMSGKQLVIAGVAGVFASTAMLVNAALQFAWRQPIGSLWLAGSLMFAGIAWYYLRQLVTRTGEKP